MEGQISIPAVPALKAHITAVISFLEGFLLSIELGKLPADSRIAENILSITSLDEVRILKALFTDVKEDERILLTESEGVQLYSFYVLMSRLLLTDEGEVFCGQLFSRWQELDLEDKELKNFTSFRRMFLVANDHLIADADRMISEAEGYAEMKERLAEMQE